MGGSDFMIFLSLTGSVINQMLEDNRDIKIIRKQSLTDGRIEKNMKSSEFLGNSETPSQYQKIIIKYFGLRTNLLSWNVFVIISLRHIQHTHFPCICFLTLKIQLYYSEVRHYL